jgi:ZIP family zinc transporter
MQVLIYSAVAGIIGMGLGGLVSSLLGKKTSEMMCWMLSFAGGVMISIVTFELIPESIALLETDGRSGIYITVIGLVIGILVVMVLNRIVDHLSFKRGFDDSPHIHHTHEELYHEGSYIRTKTLLRSGIIMLVVIALHNLPEGIAIGAADNIDERLSFTLALMIALHNIPEGMAIAAPLIGGGIKKPKAVILTAMSGSLTLVGAAIGVFVGGISPEAISISLSAAGGAMLYVVFGEIIPQSVVMTKSRFTTLVTLFGILTGLMITQI